MTALRLSIDTSHRAAAADETSLRVTTDPASWISIDVASAALEMTEDALRARLLREGWPAAGKARKGRSVSGRTCWLIHASVDPRLMRAHSPAALARVQSQMSDWDRATRPQREEAQRRLALVERFNAWRADPSVRVRQDYAAFAAALAAELGRPAPLLRQLYIWAGKAADAGTSPRARAAALLDRRGGARESDSSMSEQAWALFDQLLRDPRRRSMRQCWERVRDAAQASNWTWVSYSRAKQLVRERLTPAQLAYARLGAEVADKTHLPPVQQHPDAWAVNDVWEADHSIFDFWAREFRGGRWVAVRPWLTAWMDRRSRLLCGWHISTEHNARTIGAALYHALVTRGLPIPRLAWLDNGKDFASRAMIGLSKSERRRLSASRRQVAAQAGAVAPSDESDAEVAERRVMQMGLLGRLGIAAHFAVPYNHNGKARIERFFGTSHQRFDREQPSWCGSKPGDRDRDSLSAELADVMGLPTLDDVRAAYADWIERYYHATREHSVEDLDGMSRAEYYAARLESRRVAPRECLPELLLHTEEARSVGKLGVRLKVGDTTIWYGQHEPALQALVGTGRKVLVRYDDQDLSRVHVWSEEGRPLCVAAANERLGGLLSSPDARQRINDAGIRQRRARRQAQQRPDYDALALSAAELAAIDLERSRAADQRRGHADIAGAQLSLAPVQIDAGEARRAREARQRPRPSSIHESQQPSAADMDDVIDDLARELASAPRRVDAHDELAPDLDDLVGGEPAAELDDWSDPL